MFIEMFMFVYCSIISGLLIHHVKRSQRLEIELANLSTENEKLIERSEILAKERMDYIMAKAKNKMERMEMIYQWQASDNYNEAWDKLSEENINKIPKLPEER